MTNSAMSISSPIKPLIAAMAACVCALPAMAAAKSDNVRDREPDMRDVAVTPIADLNIAKDEIPAVLLESVEGPYAPAGSSGCDGIVQSIAELDRVLGPDYDLVDEKNDRLSEGRIAQSVVGSFIPFRSIIREVSGAADHRRQFEAAIMAGMMRRAYLKGLGQASGCPYPARPAFTRIAFTDEVVELAAAPEATED